jgi:hypothetical protein
MAYRREALVLVSEPRWMQDVLGGINLPRRRASFAAAERVIRGSLVNAVIGTPG